MANEPARCPSCGALLDSDNFEAHVGLMTILARMPRLERRVILDRLMALAANEPVVAQEASDEG